MTEADRVFSRFPDFIKEFIYNHGWTELREIQLEAARVIFETDKNLLLSSSTASGKTALSLLLAEKIPLEIISLDSMQIYKGMDIATAKPTIEEMDGIKHHLIDFIDVQSQYSVSNYCDDAKVVFDKNKKRALLRYSHASGCCKQRNNVGKRQRL